MSSEKVQENKKPDNSSVKAPETLLQLFWLMIRNFVLNIPKTVVMQLIKMAVIFVIVLLIHTYLVIVKNEGFSPDQNNKFLPITAFKATYSIAVIYWTFAAFLLSTLISRIGKDGVLVFLKEIGSSPAWLVKNFRMSGTTGLCRLMASTAFTIVAALFIRNQYLLILYALIVFFSFTSRTKGFFIYLFKLGWSDWQRIFNRKGPKEKLNMGTLSLQVFGIFLGFILAYFIPYKPYGHIAAAILLIAGAVMLTMKKVSPKVVAGFMIVITANFLLSKVGHVFADDGGWKEAGGTLGSWINSPGALPAVGLGLPPAVGGMLGGFLGGLAGVGFPPLPLDEFGLNGNNIGNVEGDGFGGGETGKSSGYNGNGAGVGNHAETGEGQSADAGSNENNSGQTGNGSDGGAEDGKAAGEPDNAEGADESGEPGDGSGEDGTEEGKDGEEGKSKFPEGTTSVENPDGSVTHTLPDGTTITDHPDGSKTGTRPDGSTASETPDGVYTETSPDGTVTTQYPDGTIVQKNPDGLTKTLTPDGIQHNSDGSTVTTNPDGSQTVTEADGTSTTLHPDGKFTTVDEKGISSTYESDGKLESRTLPNGATGTFDEDGNFEGGTMPDGKPIIVNPDGTFTITHEGVEMTYDPDTDKVTGGGTMPNGTSVRINGDGTMNMKTPDGDEVLMNMKGDFLGGTLKLDDGRIVNIDPETGSLTITAPNGDVGTVDADGNVKFEGYDGTKITIDSSGNAEAVGANGESIVKGPDGTTYTNPDGSSYHVPSDGNTMTGSDGSVRIANPDGSTDATYPDGSKLHVNADGTGTITKPDGTVWTGNEDGSQTIEKADGTLLTMGKDKSVEVKYPDGKIETYEPGEKLDHLKKIFGS